MKNKRDFVKQAISLALICFLFLTAFSLPAKPMQVYGTAFQSGTVEAVSGGVVVASTIASVSRDALSNYATYSFYIPTDGLKSSTIYLKLNGAICGIVTAVPGKSVQVNLYPLAPKVLPAPFYKVAR
jgi:hypothetical protein